MAGGRVRPFVRGGEPLILHTRGMIASRSVYMVRYPRGSYVAHPLLSPEAGTPEIKSINSTLPSICKKVRLKRGS